MYYELGGESWDGKDVCVCVCVCEVIPGLGILRDPVEREASKYVYTYTVRARARG